jgi:hypothetical protein
LRKWRETHNLDFNGALREHKDTYYIEAWDVHHLEPASEAKVTPLLVACLGCRYLKVRICGEFPFVYRDCFMRHCGQCFVQRKRCRRCGGLVVEPDN